MKSRMNALQYALLGIAILLAIYFVAELFGQEGMKKEAVKDGILRKKLRGYGDRVRFNPLWVGRV